MKVKEKNRRQKEEYRIQESGDRRNQMKIDI